MRGEHGERFSGAPGETSNSRPTGSKAMNETAINNLDELGWSDAVQSYQSVSLKSVALRITPSVQVVGIPVGIPAGLEENRSTSH